MTWHSAEMGTGRPLVLMHGIGMSGHAWKPVMPLLAKDRRVIALDVAGFGKSGPLEGEQTLENLIASLGTTLRSLGIHEPVDMAGNSMGGFLALEAAKRGWARSVVGLSPAGLWKDATIDPRVLATLRFTRWAAVNIPKVSESAMRVAPLRTLFMSVPISSRSWNMPAADAIQCSRDLRASTAFESVLEQAPTFVGGKDLKLPITVAFGSRDWLFTAKSQLRDQLPAHTKWLSPRGWGHVPMWDDPDGVARLILEGTA